MSIISYINGTISALLCDGKQESRADAVKLRDAAVNFDA